MEMVNQNNKSNTQENCENTQNPCKEQRELTSEEREWLHQVSPILKQQDFDPPVDDRVLTSNIDDIDKDNTYYDYLDEFYELCEIEEIE